MVLSRASSGVLDNTRTFRAHARGRVRAAGRSGLRGNERGSLRSLRHGAAVSACRHQGGQNSGRRRERSSDRQVGEHHVDHATADPHRDPDRGSAFDCRPRRQARPGRRRGGGACRRVADRDPDDGACRRPWHRCCDRPRHPRRAFLPAPRSPPLRRRSTPPRHPTITRSKDITIIRRRVIIMRRRPITDRRRTVTRITTITSNSLGGALPRRRWRSPASAMAAGLFGGVHRA